MERYVLFVNSETDYLLLPVRHFMGGKYSSSTVLDLYFEKAPLSYKIPLTVNANTGERAIKSIGEIFNSSSESVIVFSDTDSIYDIEDVTAVGTFVKIVTK
jgi:hypothetical protein|tara:strand:- start:2186 stop:2488 length:303 start_codon:yes stop_codon:yes gene_type:complete